VSEYTPDLCNPERFRFARNQYSNRDTRSTAAEEGTTSDRHDTAAAAAAAAETLTVEVVTHRGENRQLMERRP
jgi:hypothetical protein